MKSSRIVILLRQTLKEFTEDKVMRLSAALAYYSIFSLAPILLLAITVTGFVFGQDAAQGRLAGELEGTLGPAAAAALEDMIASARRPADNLIMSLVGLGTLIFGATGVFNQLKDALNTIWGLALKPGRGLKGILKDRLTAFSMVLAIGFLLLISMVLTTVLHAFTDVLGDALPLPPMVWQGLGFVITFLVIAVLFAAIFKVLPDAKIEWRDVRMGAVATAALFTIGKFALSLYLAREGAASPYGAAGSFILVLLWIYYSSVILLFGAEFTQVYARSHGSHIRPSKDAVDLTLDDRIHQGIAPKEVIEAKAENDPPSADANEKLSD